MSRAGRRARMQRLIAAGQWDGPADPGKRQHRPLPDDAGSLPGAQRLGWLWRHRNDGYPQPAMLTNWHRALDAMAREAANRRNAA
jgi:hypothetical protein